jgi:hypothetical protein
MSRFCVDAAPGISVFMRFVPAVGCRGGLCDVFGMHCQDALPRSFGSRYCANRHKFEVNTKFAGELRAKPANQTKKLKNE